MATEIVLVRHGETEWSRDGKHTGRTDVELTDVGRRQAEALGSALRGREFSRGLARPRARARAPPPRARYGDRVEVREELVEWDYGEYEGRTTPQIREDRPSWTLWTGGAPGGENADEVAARVDRVLGELDETEGAALVFAHGHLLRVLAARWLGLGPEAGRLLALDPATLSALGYERETPVIRMWNAPVA